VAGPHWGAVDIPPRDDVRAAGVADCAAVKASRAALAAFFSLAGTLHFVRPRPYEAIVPPPFPKRESVAISGVAELVGGIAVLHPTTRRAGRWGLIALLLAVFPANIWMAISPQKVDGLERTGIPRWALWARLPLQFLAMLWVWRATER
jgi:uncharacterized membrane protein